MKRKQQVKRFLEENYCMINSLMCNQESKMFGGDVVGIIISDIDRQMKEETEKNGGATYE